MRNMAERREIYELKQKFFSILVGFIFAFLVYSILHFLYSFISKRDNILVEKYSICQSKYEAIEKLKPIPPNKFSESSIETYNKLIKEFQEQGCTNFFPYFNP